MSAMNKSAKEKKISELKKRVTEFFPNVKFINEYDKNGTTLIEVFTSENNKEEINQLTSKLCTELLIDQGLDVLVLVYENPKVLEWFVEAESN
jgi:hypothetical protein